MADILERMAETKRAMEQRQEHKWAFRRKTPKAFYLNEEDWAEFMATKPEKIEARFRDMPSLEFGFEGVPVRIAKGLSAERSASRLYSEAGTAKHLPNK